MGLNFAEAALPRVDPARCTRCARCTEICPTGTLQLTDGRVDAAKRMFMGCIGCGQCMAVCPSEALEVRGRRFSPADVVPMPGAGLPSPDQFDALLLSRRSVRKFTAQEVDRAVVDRILDMSSTAPMGIPPTEVGVLVFHGRDRVRAFAADAADAFKRVSAGLSPLMLTLMRPFIGKANAQVLREFVRPLFAVILSEWEAGRDRICYDAPLALLFHNVSSGDAADDHIAATYAMLAAQSFGLGSCLLGTTVGLNHDKAFRAKYAIPSGNKIGLGLVAGYPAVRFERGIRRQWAEVRFA